MHIGLSATVLNLFDTRGSVSQKIIFPQTGEVLR